MSEQRIVAALVPAILHTITRGIKRIPQFDKDVADIQHSNECRRLALAEIEKAPFGWWDACQGITLQC
jgi:hypothetical protein